MRDFTGPGNRLPTFLTRREAEGRNMAFVRKRNPVRKSGNRLMDCDRCGYTIHEGDAVHQNGLRLDKSCKDKLDNQTGKI